MTCEELTEAIILARKDKGLSWEDIAAHLEVGVVWVTSACFGNNSMPKAPATKLCALLELPDQAMTTLMEYPTKSWGVMSLKIRLSIDSMRPLASTAQALKKWFKKSSEMAL